MAGIIRTAFEEFDADQVEPRHCAAFIDENFSATPNAANKYKALLSLIFAHGVRKGYRNDNPTRELRNYDDDGGRSRYITDNELARLRAAALVGEDGLRTRSGPMMVCLFDLAVITGQRIGDLLALKWSQVSDEGILFEPAKTKRSSGVRVPVAMTRQLKAMLERARTIGDVKSLYVIHTLDGRPYGYHGAQSAWKRACERARANYETECAKRAEQPVEAFLTDMHFHDLKHRALTDAKRQGHDAQKLGGHTTAKMTAQYIEEVGIDWVQPPVNSVIGG
jgi:integrase